MKTRTEYTLSLIHISPSMDVIPVRTERKNNEDRSEKNIYH